MPLVLIGHDKIIIEDFITQAWEDGIINDDTMSKLQDYVENADWE